MTIKELKEMLFQLSLKLYNVNEDVEICISDGDALYNLTSNIEVSSNIIFDKNQIDNINDNEVNTLVIFNIEKR